MMRGLGSIELLRHGQCRRSSDERGLKSCAAAGAGAADAARRRATRCWEAKAAGDGAEPPRSACGHVDVSASGRERRLSMVPSAAASLVFVSSSALAPLRPRLLSLAVLTRHARCSSWSLTSCSVDSSRRERAGAVSRSKVTYQTRMRPLAVPGDDAQQAVDEVIAGRVDHVQTADRITNDRPSDTDDNVDGSALDEATLSIAEQVGEAHRLPSAGYRRCWLLLAAAEARGDGSSSDGCLGAVRA